MLRLPDKRPRIDKNSGASSLIGPVGFDANFAQGMDFGASDGTCYLFAFNDTTFRAELHTCNTSTGAATLVGQIGEFLQREWTAAGMLAEDDSPGCSLESTAQVRRRGERRALQVDLQLTHVRAKAVSRAFKITVDDAAGRTVASKVTPRSELRPNKTVRRSYELVLPEGLPPGEYLVSISINGMQQGTARSSVPVTIE